MEPAVLGSSHSDQLVASQQSDRPTVPLPCCPAIRHRSPVGDVPARRIVEVDSGKVWKQRAGGEKSRRSQLVEGHRLLHPKRSDSFAAELGEMGPHAQADSQIASNGTDIGPGADDCSKRNLGRLVAYQVNAMDGNADVRQLDRLTPPGLGITPLPTDALG
jgi:hypothetical protein